MAPQETLPPDSLKVYSLLHRLAEDFGPNVRLLGERYRHSNSSNEVLAAFLADPSLAPKFVEVTQAITTILTPYKGQNNFALVLGAADGELHLFYCKNGGGKDPILTAHLQAVWALPKLIRLRTPSKSIPHHTPSPELKHFDDGPVKRFRVLAYQFVARKVLARAKKQAASIDSLRSLAMHRKQEDFEVTLLELMNMTCVSAMDSLEAATTAKAAIDAASLARAKVWRTRSGSKVDHAQAVQEATEADAVVQALAPRGDLFTSGDMFEREGWTVFMESAAALQAHLGRHKHEVVMVQLKQDANGLGLDLDRVMRKFLRVEAALTSLIQLAVSSRRGHIVQDQLVVHSVPLPERSTINIPLGSDLPADLQEAETPMVSIQAKAHSEVELVAWLATHHQAQFPTVKLFPYVTCSELHYPACYLWLSEFSALTSNPTFPSLGFNGSHGPLQPGWVPPTLDTPEGRQILTQMASRLGSEHQRHAQELSASTTGSAHAGAIEGPNIEAVLQKGRGKFGF
ncbi:hypothetical protein C8R46DRAFT_1360675 [Mycena filopes]|nr:hypothetical protein C8R46DRAFT_1360675 [Mycena filopes]